VDVIQWLLDSDPAIRWQVMRDLVGAPESIVAVERARVEHSGWGGRLLALQDEDGHWGGGAYVSPGWTSTTESLMTLRDLGLDPKSGPAREAMERMRAKKASWGPEFDNVPFFDGEVEPCINGRVLAAGAYFGVASTRPLDFLLDEQLPDGGWNCEASPGLKSSFHTTICVLEGLLEFEKGYGASRALTVARLRGQEYLLDRNLIRSRTTGGLIDPDWLMFSFPTRWYFDVLWGLDYLRRAEVRPDERLAEAVNLVVLKQGVDGRWPLENPHPGAVHFEMETDVEGPSRWNTLRALRVLGWARG